MKDQGSAFYTFFIIIKLFINLQLTVCNLLYILLLIPRNLFSNFLKMKSVKLHFISFPTIEWLSKHLQRSLIIVTTDYQRNIRHRAINLSYLGVTCSAEV